MKLKTKNNNDMFNSYFAVKCKLINTMHNTVHTIRFECGTYTCSVKQYLKERTA